MNFSKRTLAITMLALLFLCPMVTPAQWTRKPYAEWSESDALKLLRDSPWGQTEVFSSLPDRNASPNSEVDADRAIDAGGSRINRAAQINFRICFLSARPIRQAISRLIKIRQGGDLKEDFSARLESFVEKESPEQIVISIFFDAPRPSTRLMNVRDMLDRLTTEELKSKTYLSVEGGRRVSLQDYLPPRDDGLGARFVFPRIMDDKPVLTLENHEIRFHSQLSDDYTLNKSFKVKDMIYENRLEY